METSEKIIEDLCWGDIFKTHNVVDYCIGFIVLIVVNMFRVTKGGRCLRSALPLARARTAPIN